MDSDVIQERRPHVGGCSKEPRFVFQVKLESNFASIVFAIMVLEGLGRSLDPQLDILEAARPFLLRGPASSPDGGEGVP